MIILQDSQIKKIFHNGDEVKKILDWDGNVIFYKQSGGGGMTNDIKFTTSPSVSSANVFRVTYTDSTRDTVRFSEPSKEYSLSIPTDKIVNKIDFDNTMVDEVSVSCKVKLSNTFFTKKPKTIRFINCDATSSTSLMNLFQNSKNIETIEMNGVDARNATNMFGTFAGCSGATTIDIANWNTSSITDLTNTFYDCLNVTSLDLSSWNTSNVTNMTGMFYMHIKENEQRPWEGGDYSKLASLNLRGWNTGKVTDMSFMFKGCQSLTSLDLSHFNTSKVKDMSYMFDTSIEGYVPGAESHLTSLNLSGWNTSNVTDMDSMFSNCNSLTSLDLSKWNTSKVTSISGMFSGCGKLNTIRMVGCKQPTIDKIKERLTADGISLNNVNFVTE